MRSFFSMFFGSIFGAMPCLVFCAMALAISPISAQTPSAPTYDPALNPGIIPAPQMIEMSPRILML
ncbi:MAG: hypothetical protein FJ333_08760, partial [Sphingomonadales bacterium]|nr:hypothetical protein [Sphingomonadales bacterium]